MLEWLFVLFIAVSFALLNSWGVISQWLRNKPGFTFTGIAHYYGDYFLYVSQMAQGAAGHVFFYAHRFTNEPLPDTWIWWFNGLIGYLGNLAGLSVFASYNLALIVLVIILILLWYIVARLVYPFDRFSRFVFLLFILTASSFFDIKKFFTVGAVKNLGAFWFSPMPAGNRLGGVPHQVWQTTLMILLTIVFTRVLKLFSIKVAESQQNFDWLHFASENKGVYKHDNYSRGKPETINNFCWRPQQLYVVGLLVTLVILTMLAASGNPITMLVFLFAAAAATALQIIRQKVFNPRGLLPLFIVGAATLPAAWITNQAFNTILFQTVKFWEASQLLGITIYDFLLALGPVILFIPFGFSLKPKNWSLFKFILVTLTITGITIFFSPLPRFLTTAPARYLSPVTLAGVAILATDGINKLLRLAKNHRLSGILVTVLCAIYLFFSFFSIRDQVLSKTDTNRNPILTSYLNHVPEKFIQALKFLKNQPFTPRPVVIIQPDEDLDINNLIPVFTDKISFTGHPLHTLYGPQKEALVKDFFDSRMNQDEIKRIFDNHRIGYIIAKSGTPSQIYLDSLTFIKEIYNSLGIIIYKVNLP